MPGDLDFFGYQRELVGQNHLISSDYTSIFIPAPNGNGRLGLVQGSQLTYGHRVMPRFEGGSSELYWVTGQPSGALQVGRLVGNNGVLASLRPESNPGSIRKAVLSSVEFKVGRASLSGVTTSQDVIVLRGCVMENVSWNFNVGGLDVAESFNIQAALVKKASGGFAA